MTTPAEENIQERLQRLAPDLLEFLRSRTIPPTINEDGVCQRCRALVDLNSEDSFAKHVEWHESISIGFDSIAGLILTKRLHVILTFVRWVTSRIPKGGS